MSSLRLRAVDERGAILVMAAIWMVSAIALVIFAVDVGHWFEHKRHLQLQVDAGAFAGGTGFNACVAATPAQRVDPAGAANTGIANVARQFSGDRQTIATAYNQQVSNKANVTVLLNSSKYANQSGAANNSDPAGPPCAAKFLDVKATDASLPWFFKSHLVPAINAHARVSARTITTLSGSLPIAIQDVNPQEVAALFVDETANPDTVIASRKLTNHGTQTLNGKTVVEWDNIGNSVPVNIQHANNGVILALSGVTTWSLTSNSVSTICGQLFVVCYGINGASYTGIGFIHGYPTAGTGAAGAPILRDVQLYNQSCTDASGPYFVLNGNCTFGVHAKIDFGINPTPAGVAVKVGGLGCPNSGQNPKGCPMAYNAGTGYWDMTGASYPTIGSAAGALPVTINWGTTAGGNNNSFSTVARPYSAFEDTSGPVDYVRITESGTGANSLSFTSHNLEVAIGLGGNLANASSASDPTVILRFASGAASNSGGLDCDTAYNSDHELHYGCETPYTLNPGVPCAGNTPPYCIPVQTGNYTGPLRSGLNARFAGCPANNWVAPVGGGLPTIQDGDPRLIPLIITSYGAFAHNGNTNVPVVNFGAFYITGWDQGPGGGPCAMTGAPANEPFPGTGSSSGDVWGHFYKYVGSLPGGTGDTACDFSAFGLCTVQLTY